VKEGLRTTGVKKVAKSEKKGRPMRPEKKRFPIGRSYKKKTAGLQKRERTIKGKEKKGEKKFHITGLLLRRKKAFRAAERDHAGKGKKSLTRRGGGKKGKN